MSCRPPISRPASSISGSHVAVNLPRSGEDVVDEVGGAERRAGEGEHAHLEGQEQERPGDPAGGALRAETAKATSRGTSGSTSTPDTGKWTIGTSFAIDPSAWKQGSPKFVSASSVIRGSSALVVGLGGLVCRGFQALSARARVLL